MIPQHTCRAQAPHCGCTHIADRGSRSFPPLALTPPAEPHTSSLCVCSITSLPHLPQCSAASYLINLNTLRFSTYPHNLAVLASVCSPHLKPCRPCTCALLEPHDPALPGLEPSHRLRCIGLCMSSALYSSCSALSDLEPRTDCVSRPGHLCANCPHTKQPVSWSLTSVSWACPCCRQ